jgi:hypothetical protein
VVPAAVNWSEPEPDPDELWDELLRADPHRFGPGKVHLFTNNRTRCGKSRESCPGKLERDGLDQIDCKGCLNGIEADHRRQRQQVEWEHEQAVREAQRQRESERWWAQYNAYLESPQWRRRRELVLSRAGGVCEGCGERRAVQVHHRTYEHVRNELLWELVAVCEDCHRRCHPGKDLAA